MFSDTEDFKNRKEIHELLTCTPLFDTMKFCRSLRNVGFNEKQASGLTDEISKLVSHLACWHFVSRN
jgi:hypothetical protein